MPEGEVVVRLYDGAVGPTYLAHAQAQASLSAAQQLAFSADLAPAEAGRHSGHVRVSGSIPLRSPLPAPAGRQQSASALPMPYRCRAACNHVRRLQQPQRQPLSMALGKAAQCYDCAGMRARVPALQHHGCTWVLCI